MTFIRRVRAKPGATAVQVARYVNGRQEIVEHIGSAHTDIELGILLERARSWIEPDQHVLDLVYGATGSRRRPGRHVGYAFHAR